MSSVQDGRLGKYEIVGTLGRGAMGTVYDGRDPVIERRVAIKTIPLTSAAEDAEAAAELARFKREAQAAGRLQHPNIVGVYDYGETETMAYIVMEFVDGTSLKSMLDRGERMAPAEVGRIMQQVLAALQYSHEHGVVHRDIKPANVMITKAGMVKIADFGIARIESSSLTQAGTIMGTPAYMSPEQFMGQTVDARTDIYSAGVVLYQLLTGERPFEGSLTAIMHKALNTVPPRPSEISVTSPAGLDAVVATAMAKRPEQRYQSAATFATALAEGLSAAPPVTDGDATLLVPVARPAPQSGAASGPKAADPAPVSLPPTGPARGRAPLFAGVGVVVLAVAGAAGYLTLRPASVPTSAPPVAAPVQPGPQAAVPKPVPAPPAPVAPAKITTETTPPQQQAAATPPPPAAQPAAAPPPEFAGTPAKPVETANAAITPEALRKTVRAAIAPVGCALLGGNVGPDGRVMVDGVVSSETAPKLTRAIAEAAPAAASDLQVATFNGPYCSLLDTLRPISAGFAQAGSGLQVGLRSGRAALPKNVYLIPTITMPDWPAYLTVDYFQTDGGLTHLYPGAKDRPHGYAAGAHVVLGDPKSGAAGWLVDHPFGTDMIVAIASQKPLFAKPRPDDDTAAAYLPALGAAIEAARHRGENVAASAEVVKTVEK